MFNCIVQISLFICIIHVKNHAHISRVHDVNCPALQSYMYEQRIVRGVKNNERRNVRTENCPYFFGHLYKHNAELQFNGFQTIISFIPYDVVGNISFFNE